MVCSPDTIGDKHVGGIDAQQGDRAAIVATGETRGYGNILLKKGVVRP